MRGRRPDLKTIETQAAHVMPGAVLPVVPDFFAR